MGKPKDFQYAYLNDGVDVKIFNSIKRCGKYFSVHLSADCEIGENAIESTIGAFKLIAKTRYLAKGVADRATAIVVDKLESRLVHEPKVAMKIRNKQNKDSCEVFSGRYCNVKAIVNAFNAVIDDSPALSERFVAYSTKEISTPVVPYAEGESLPPLLDEFCKLVSAS